MKEKLTLVEKLLEIKKKVPYIKKDKKGYNYDYASPEEVLSLFNPLFNEYAVLLKTEALEVKHERIVDKKGSIETLFIATLLFTWINVDSPEDTLPVRWVSAAANGSEKGIGSLFTYAERYFILKQFNVATGKDDPDARQEKNKNSKQGGIKEDIIEKIQSMTSMEALKKVQSKAESHMNIMSQADVTEIVKEFKAKSNELKAIEESKSATKDKSSTTEGGDDQVKPISKKQLDRLTSTAKKNGWTKKSVLEQAKMLGFKGLEEITNWDFDTVMEVISKKKGKK